MNKIPRKFKIFSLALLFALAVWAFFIEPSGLRFNHDKLVVPAWPASCNGTTIAVLADLHVGSPYKGLSSLRKLVEKVNANKPDLILLPGDFVIQGVVGGAFVSPEDAAKVLGNLSAPMGVYAVLGNHDWWLGAKRMVEALTSNDITVLEDASTRIEHKGCSFTLVGISDFWEGPHDIKKAMAQVDPKDSVLAFTHNPDVFPQLSPQVLLTIAGHTHGGQVYIPFLGRPIVPSDYGERYAIGHIEEKGKHLYVSPGVGTSIFPVRFLVPPEATVLNVSNRWDKTPRQ